MSLLPPFYLDTVVAIGVGDDQATRKWIGTGFIVGKPIDVSVELAQRQYSIYIVTNKHVLNNVSRIYVKFNSENDPLSMDYAIDLTDPTGARTSIGHPNLDTDVAVIWINGQILRNEGRILQFIQLENHSFSRADLLARMTTEGDRIFVLGYPMGLVAADRQYVICRSGCYARIRDFLENRKTDYLIDASVFPGNSGGPVISCPSAISIQGTIPNDKANLIGIVKAYLPYQDVAVSQQTGRARIVFEENTGLTIVESVDSINETIAAWENRNN